MDEKYEIITRNIQEILGEERIKPILRVRNLKVYWGTATTGRPHIGYFIPIIKICDFIKAGCEVTILLADLHSHLDDSKTSLELLNYRAKYYQEIVTSMIESIISPPQSLRFVRGSDFQFDKEYIKDVYNLTCIATDHDIRRASSGVVRKLDNPKVSGLLYPILQTLDEHYLDVDIQLGGIDQRKIFILAEKYLPVLGYDKRIHLMNPILPGLNGTKMNSSSNDTKIDLLDNWDFIKEKLTKFEIEILKMDGFILKFIKYIIFPIYGYFMEFKSFKEFENSMITGELDNDILIINVEKHIDILLFPIRKRFEDPNLKDLINKAYPEI